MDLFNLFDDEYYNLHYSNDSGRYFIQFFLSIRIQATYDYLWDISCIEEKIDDFLQKYRSTRFGETVKILLSDPYENNGLIKLWDLTIYIKTLSDVVANYHEEAFKEDPAINMEVLKYDEFVQSPEIKDSPGPWFPVSDE